MYKVYITFILSLALLVLARPKDEKLQTEATNKSENSLNYNQTVSTKTTQNVTVALNANSTRSGGTHSENNASTSMYTEEVTTMFNNVVPLMPESGEPALAPMLPNAVYSSEEVVVCGSANSSEVIIPVF